MHSRQRIGVDEVNSLFGILQLENHPNNQGKFNLIENLWLTSHFLQLVLLGHKAYFGS